MNSSDRPTCPWSAFRQ